jgi:energy-coupling factor transport system permease protein
MLPRSQEQLMQLTIPDKLSFVLLAWTCAFLLPWQFNIPLIVVLVLLAYTAKPFKPISPAARKYVSRFVAYSFLLILVLVAVNGLLVREGPIRLKLLVLDFYDAGLAYGLTVSVRLILLSLSLLVFFASIHFQDFAKYLQSIGLPSSFVSIILLTMFFLEQLPHRIEQIFTAQEARGAPVRAGIVARSRAFFLVLSPLVLSSIVESVERGIALELRGYRFTRTKKSPLQIQPSSLFWRCGFLTLSFVIIILSVVHWLSN